MAFRPPLVLASGQEQQLQSGDYAGQDNLMVIVKDEPLPLASGDVYNLNSGVLWTDASISPFLSFNNYEPGSDLVFYPGATVQLEDDPFIIDSETVADLGGNPNTLLWTDAARCPQTISTLLVIGI